jgi:Zn-dependent M16 (insulinase) family peptidase
MFVVAVSFSRRSSNGIVRFFGASRTRSGYEGFSTLQKGSQLGSSKGGAIAFDSSVTEVSHPAFVALTHDIIEEYGVHATLYRHKKSGAQVLSVVAPEDNNKVFGVTFRTPPDDSKGLPHILEHSVLCGSRKFPVKEPFVDLMKGSLNTFLNAFTYPDRTCYPVASMNTKDFYNLIHVYMDAVFHPRAVNDPQVLEQEGWHFELEKPEDPLTFKGVVYNEMKGVYSSPDSIMGRATQRALFPDNTYSVDSGGDPLEIPKLGFDQFKSFHSKYYHPSNARVYFYGDDDPSERLRLLDSYLDEFTAIEVDSTISTQRKFTEPRRIDVKFPIATGTEPKYMLTVNWLLNEESMPHPERLAVGVLESLLLGTSSSPLRKKLIESGFGEGVTGGGLSDELLQSTFSVGLKGVKPENADKIEQLVLDELARLQKEGFDQGDVRAALNTLEFSLREFNTGGFPRGLSLMLGFLGDWIYDRDPLDGVRFEEALQTLKTDLAAGKPVFQSLLQKYFVDNRHRVTVEARPDETLEAMQQQAEAATLAEVKAGLGLADLDKIIQSTKDLKAAQAAEDSAGKYNV